MDQLRTRLKTAKSKETKSLKKIELVVNLFEKYEQERGSAKRLNSKSKEIQMFLSRLENEYNEIYEVISALKEVIYASANDELTDTRANTMGQLENDIETFLKRLQTGERRNSDESNRKRH